MATIETQLLENVREFTAFARKRLRDPELAADVVQESLLKALRSSDQLRDVRDRALEDLERELDGVQNGGEERVVCSCMERLLPRMAAQYSELIRRIDLNEENSDLVAAELGITKNNLNVRLHRARQQLKRRLEENCRVCAKHGCLDCQCGSSNGPAV